MPRPHPHPCRPNHTGFEPNINPTVGAGVPAAPANLPPPPPSRDGRKRPPFVGAGSQGTLAGYPARIPILAAQNLSDLQQT